MTDIVIVGGGPIGLWTAIQLKKRRPAQAVRVYERHMVYQRSHVLRLDHWSMMLYAASARNPAETRFVKEVTGKNVSGLHTLPARSLYIRTNDFEVALQRYARDLGVDICVERIAGACDVQARHPECALFIAADGAHSPLRGELFGADAFESTTLQHLVEMKCEERTAGGPVPRLDATQMLRLNRGMCHPAAEYVGRTMDGVAPITLRLFLSAAEYARLPAMSFKVPHPLGAPGLPESVERDLQIYLATRIAFGGDLVPGSERVTKLQLNSYAAKRFAIMRGEVAWFLVGDAAMGVPYFRALNGGLMLASRLAQIIGKTDYPREGELATKVSRYDKWYRPKHVDTEFAIARGKNLLLDALHLAHEQFSLAPRPGETST
jgi:2-polyprenyl-6-methoxyphenol hydroxylase-like FAD-dependent oxidoreductase